jgi:hypothetical protein
MTGVLLVGVRPWRNGVADRPLKPLFAGTLVPAKVPNLELPPRGSGPDYGSRRGHDNAAAAAACHGER